MTITHKEQIFWWLTTRWIICAFLTSCCPMPDIRFARFRPVVWHFRPPKKKQPDLILLDIKMPDMDGFTVCRELKGDPLTADISSGKKGKIAVKSGFSSPSPSGSESMVVLV